MKKNKNKVFYMTLIEVLIATFLTMILLTAITFFYRQVTLMAKESEKMQQEQFKQAYLEKRLSNTIPKTVSPRNPQNDFYFFTSDASGETGGTHLVFTYDHGVNAESKLSNHLLGRLFLDAENNLVLASFPSPHSWEINPNLTVRKEILAEKISNLSFEFYVPPKKDRSAIVKTSQTLNEILPENSWHKSWKSNYNQLPAMIKINLTKKINDNEVQTVFAFPLPNSDMVIMY